MKSSLRALALTSVLAGAVISGASPADAQVTIQFRFGTRDRPLERRQFETMRALAHYLDEAAQQASTTAVDNVRGRSRSTRQFLASLDGFSQRATAFHERMDTYETRPWDIPSELGALDRSAARVNDTIRRMRLYADVADDWNNVVDVLDRMKRLLAGEEVHVPHAHGRGRDYDRDYGPFREGNSGGYERDPNRHGGTSDPDYRSGPGDSRGSAYDDSAYMGSSRLSQFSDLIEELDFHVTRAHELAERTARQSDGSQALFVRIHQLNDEVRALRQRASSGQLDRRELRPAIYHLLQDAEATDRQMREANVLRVVWNEWQQAIDIIHQIAESLR